MICLRLTCNVLGKIRECQLKPCTKDNQVAGAIEIQYFSIYSSAPATY